VIEEYYIKMRQQELLAEAEQRRLLANYKSTKPFGLLFAARLLLWLGALLSRWGRQLQVELALDSDSDQVQSIDCGLSA
jgi:hypothetical protein